MKQLFDPGTYQGCRISLPDLQTIVVEAVGKTSLRIVFRQEIEHWTVRLSVTACFTEEPAPNEALLCAGIDGTPEIIDFWDQLARMRSEAENDQMESRLRQARKILKSGGRSKDRRNQ